MLSHLLLLSIVAPLAAAAVVASGLPARVAKVVAALGFAVPALIALHVWYHFPAGAGAGYEFLQAYNTGLQNLGIKLTLGLNGIALPLFVLAGLVGLAAGLYAIQSGAERLKTYLALLLVMQAGLMGVFASVDIFFFYFFHELALIPTFIMVGIWGGKDRGYAAMKMTIYLTVGAMLSLLGLIAIYYKSGAESFDLITLRATLLEGGIKAGTQNHIFGLLMFGFGILVSLWPLHTWAPLGYGAAPSSAAMLHAGVLKKFGLYGLVQIAVPLLPLGAAHWATPLAWLAVAGNLLVIGFVTIAQRDLKQMVGYSSVMHMGYAFLGVATLSAVGAGGVVLMMVAHGFSVALLFLLSTSVYHRTQTFDLTEMGGLAQKAPVLAAFFVRHHGRHRSAGSGQLLGRTHDLRRSLGILQDAHRARHLRRGHLGDLRPPRRRQGVLRSTERSVCQGHRRKAPGRSPLVREDPCAHLDRRAVLHRLLAQVPFHTAQHRAGDRLSRQGPGHHHRRPEVIS